MIIKSFFTDSGIPKTGLIPKISIKRISDDVLVVDQASMTEVSNGWYKYSFTNTITEEYYVWVDGTATLQNFDRYQYGVVEKDYQNELASTISATLENSLEDDDGRIV